MTARDSLKATLASDTFRNAAGVSPQWVLFGSSGLATPPASQLAGYHNCNSTLSHQLKCIANSASLHTLGAFRPTHVHQCAFQLGAVPLLGDGAETFTRTMPMPRKVNKHRIVEKCDQHRAHLPPEEYEGHELLTDAHKIVLFHYVTRSQEDFVGKKVLQGKGGKFQQRFLAIAEEILGDEKETALHDDAVAARVFAALEHEFGFDGDAAICGEGAGLAQGLAAAEAAGWSATGADAGGRKKGGRRKERG